MTASTSAAFHLSELPDNLVETLSKEQEREAFDCAARVYLDMSGEEFLRRWDAGEFDDKRDDARVVHMAMLIPFIRP